ncbi:MAG: IgGFc-binding protein, partial [Myxococcales bacterium]|nr:IgGFc-binding protein [Myxococcales bacterium]
MPHEAKKPSAAAVVSILVFASLVPLACGEERNLGGDAPSFPEAGAPDAPQCGYRCSPDLKKVLSTCEGESETVKEVCSADEGCGIDRCVSACDAAALSKGSAGCGFWTLPPDDAVYGAGSCFAAMVANTWDRPVTISAEWGADPLDISRSVYTASRLSGEPEYTLLEGPLPPGQVAIVFLSQKKAPIGSDKFIACPAGTTPAVDADPIKHGTARTKAFHLEMDAPVSAYSIFPYGGAASEVPSATLLLPETSWEKAYIGVTVARFGDPGRTFGEKRTFQIIGTEDGTKVSMKPNFDISGAEGIEPGVAGEVKTWSLARGEVLQFTQDGLISGSPIEADRPIGLFGASPCAFLPGEKGYCDVFGQQIAPLSQWGTEYALVPYRSRLETSAAPLRETVDWSFVGAVDGTV